MLGYIFLSENDAYTSRELCDTYYGIPVSPESITTNWCEYHLSTNGEFWYIIYDDSLRIILGEPIEFEP